MSSFLRTSIIRAARPATRSSVAFHNARAFTNSSVMSLKESHDKSDPNLPNELDKHKHDQLAKVKEGKNHWKPELASNSEEAVCFSLFPYCPVAIFLYAFFSFSQERKGRAGEGINMRRMDTHIYGRCRSPRTQRSLGGRAQGVAEADGETCSGKAQPPLWPESGRREKAVVV
ncbi:Mitochondrial carrier PET8 protein [Rutstroemia sp. NJR-2017a BVV2]|nr:Mitochondrial carrier PET8 protein [Rutstroemia sp. NJR-2017a BVV2]